MITPKDLLFSNRITFRRDDPFLFFYVDEFLPKTVYEELVQTFPSKDRFGQKYEEGKLFLTKGDYEEFSTQFPAWRELSQAIRSEEFLRDVSKVTRSSACRSRGRRFSGKWTLKHPLSRRVNDKLRLPFYAPVSKVRLEISSLPHGASFPPHTDSTRKLVSLILYIRPKEWRDEYQGGTEWYYPSSQKSVNNYRNWNNDGLSQEQDANFSRDMKLLHKTPYVGNRLAGFVKTDLSWHSIPEIQSAPDVHRGSLNINIMTNRG